MSVMRNPDWWTVGITAVLALFAGWTLLEIHRSTLLDQRAWIGVETIRGIPSVPEVNKPYDVAVVFTNSGKTPAKNVVMYNHVIPSPTLPVVRESCREAIRTHESTTMIAPNATLTQFLHPTNGKPLPDGWDVDLAHKGRLYVYGCVLYDDIFEKSHWLTYCGVLNPTSKAFDTCEKYTDTGDGKSPP